MRPHMMRGPRARRQARRRECRMVRPCIRGHVPRSLPRLRGRAGAPVLYRSARALVVTEGSSNRVDRGRHVRHVRHVDCLFVHHIAISGCSRTCILTGVRRPVDADDGAIGGGQEHAQVADAQPEDGLR